MGALFANTLGIQLYGRGCDTPESGLADVNLRDRRDEVARDAHRRGAGLGDIRAGGDCHRYSGAHETR